MRIWRSGSSSDSGTTKDAVYNSEGGYWQVKFSEADIKKGNKGDVACVEAWAYDKENNKSDSKANYDFPFAGKTSGLGTFKARIVLKEDTNYCLGISGKNNGDVLQLKTKDTKDETQIWEITERADGLYKIINTYVNKSIDVSGGSQVDNDGAKIQLSDYVSGQYNLKFMLQEYNKGYRILPSHTGYCRALDVKDGKIVNNQQIQLYSTNTSNNKAQTWIFEEVVDYPKGDINGDGEINARDAKLAIQHFTGKIELTDEQIARADVYADGEINARDAKLIIQFFTGKITEF